MNPADEQNPPPAGGAPVLRIGLLWHSLVSGNLGVGALTHANIAIARQVAAELGFAPHFVVLGMRDSGRAPPLPADIEIFPIDARAMLLPGGFWKQLGTLDCVLDIGAGDSFADIYGPKRFAYLWLSKLLAEVRGVPLLLSPQTIGPFTKPAYRWLAQRVLPAADAVVARDVPSLEALRALSPRAKGHLSTDVAFMLPFEDRSALRGGEKLRVGVNPSGLLFHQAEAGQNAFGLSMNYAVFTRGLIEALIARGDAEVHLIAHANSDGNPADDDAATLDRLAAEYPAVVRVPNFAGPSEAKSYISGLDMLIAARMHACIGAFSAGTPVVPVAYSRKFSGLFGLLGYDWLIPVQGVDETQAIAHVMHAVDSRDELAAGARQGMAKVGALLDTYRDALRSLFRAARRRQR